MIIDARAKIITLPGESIGVYLHDLGLGYEWFLRYDTESTCGKRKNKLYVRGQQYETKTHPTEWEKIFAISTSDKGLTSRNIKNTTQS